MASSKKELKEIIKAAQNQGWRVEATKKGHQMFYAPDGVKCRLSGWHVRWRKRHAKPDRKAQELWFRLEGTVI